LSFERVSIYPGIIIGSGSHGRLVVDGASAGVTITSAQSSPAAGDWNGILFHYYDDGSELTGATISYGGANGYGDAYLYYSDPIFEDCTFSHSTTSGVYVSTGSYPTISGCTVSDNDKKYVVL
jgi:parallel beta-helix repeat protein